MLTLFTFSNGCPTCGSQLLDGHCPRCQHGAANLQRLAAELQAAQLLGMYCQIRCRRAVVVNGAASTWRVDLPTGKTTLLSGCTLLLMAEKRLPAAVWSTNEDTGHADHS